MPVTPPPPPAPAPSPPPTTPEAAAGEPVAGGGRRDHVILKRQVGYARAEIAERVGAILDALELDVQNKRVYLKPSFVVPVPELPHVNTHPQFVLGVIDALLERTAREVIVGEGNTTGTGWFAFSNIGILDELKRLRKATRGVSTHGRVHWVFHDKTEMVTKHVSPRHVCEDFPVPKAWLDADLFFSLPKLKTNIYTTLTLSVKNNMGFLRIKDRLRYHGRYLHDFLADLYHVRPPDAVIVDAILPGEGNGPLDADPVEFNLIVGGRNAVAVDATCCHLVGVDPGAVRYLALLGEDGDGPLEVSEIPVALPDGVDALADLAREFARPDLDLAHFHPNIEVYGKRACQPGCLGQVMSFLLGYQKHYGREFFDDLDQKVALVVGQPGRRDAKKLVKRQARGEYGSVILFGKCAQVLKKHLKGATRIKGCPPYYNFSILKFQRALGRLSPWVKLVPLGKLGWSYVRRVFSKKRG